LKFLVIFKRTCEFHNIGVLAKDPTDQTNSSLLILLNLRVGVKAMYGQLDSKEISKRRKVPERASGFYKFGVRNFIMKSNRKKQNL
jgi:hypothetical protein